jgi:hypothetical protein
LRNKWHPKRRQIPLQKPNKKQLPPTATDPLQHRFEAQQLFNLGAHLCPRLLLGVVR